MADEREGAEGPRSSPANENRLQSGGRAQNAAQPLNAARDQGGAERYPPVSQSDGVEPRSFDPAADAPTPRQGAGDGGPAATEEGRLGPQGDPAEGRR